MEVPQPRVPAPPPSAGRQVTVYNLWDDCVQAQKYFRVSEKILIVLGKSFLRVPGGASRSPSLPLFGQLRTSRSRSELVAVAESADLKS